jgi:hypothetical protein
MSCRSVPSGESGYAPSVSPDSTWTDELAILIEACAMGESIQDRAHVMHSFDLLHTLVLAVGSSEPPKPGSATVLSSGFHASRTGTQTILQSVTDFVVFETKQYRMFGTLAYGRLRSAGDQMIRSLSQVLFISDPYRQLHE